MRKQKTRENGITLIALVISIIVMLILAGVSLNATVGYYSATTMETTLSDIQSGFTVVTKEEFKNLDDGSMKFNLEGD